MITYILIGVAIILFIIMLIFSATAYKRFIVAYKKYSQHYTYCGYNGFALANFMIQKFNLKTKICLTKQELADSYLINKNIVLLSENVAVSSTIASVAITAHELSHAYQHKKKNFLFILSAVLSVVTRFAKYFLAPVFVTGIILLFFAEYNMTGQILLIITASVIILSYVLKLINIPVEFGASKIAYNFLKDNEILNSDELKLAKKMLRVAGQTYIASLFMGFVKFFKKVGNAFRS